MNKEETKKLIEWEDSTREAKEAHVRGEEVEFMEDGEWSSFPAGNPNWMRPMQYRPKPKLRERWGVFAKSGLCRVTCLTESEAKGSIADPGDTIVHFKEVVK